VCGVKATVFERTRYAFEIVADTPEEACDFVTRLFRSVYGLNWWAEVVSLRGEPSRPSVASQAVWN
jgi:hypothetical protein